MESITDKSISLANALKSIAADMDAQVATIDGLAFTAEDSDNIRESARIVAIFVQHEGDIGRARAEGMKAERITMLRNCAGWARAYDGTRGDFATWMEALADAWGAQ